MAADLFPIRFEGTGSTASRLIGGLLLALVGSTTGCAADNATPPSLVALTNGSAPAHDLSGASYCAGVLISGDRILTAAHCREEIGSTGPLGAAQVGAVNLCSTAPIDGLRVEIVDATVPPDSGDLAVLTVRAGGPSPVPKIADASPAVGDTLTAWGWGSEVPGAAKACSAEAKRLVVVPDSDCERVLAESLPGPYFCAIPAAGSGNTCTGDSGGPVFTTRGELVGIVAGGAGCAVDDPGTYVDVVTALGRG
jgi:trypsin